MTNEKINATVEEIMEYEALLDEVKGIVDGLKDNLKNEMAERNVYTDQIEHTARRFSAWLPPIQCTLSGHQCMMIIQG